MKYQCVLQHDATDCGAACISTICKQYGLNKNISKIREMAMTDRNGTNGIGLVKAATELGFEAFGAEVENKDLSQDGIIFPCIAHVIKDGMNHYVVIHGMKKGRIIIADPGEGLVEYSKDKFDKLWTSIIFILKPTDRIQQMNNDTGVLSILFNLIKKRKGLISSIILTSIFYTALGILGTLFFQLTFDTFIPKKKLNLLEQFGVGFMLCNIMKGIVQYIRIKLILKLGKQFDMELTFDSYVHIMELPMRFFALRQTGEIISRLNDASKIRDALSGVTVSVVVDTVLSLACGVFLFLYNKVLFLVAVITLVIYGTVEFANVKKIKQKNREVLEQSAEVNSMFIETIKGSETIKSCGAEKKVEEDSKDIFVKLLDSSISCQRIQSFLGIITTTVCSLGYVLIIWIGALQVIDGKMTVGALLTFYSLLGFFLSPIQRIMDLQINLQGAFIAMERLEQLLESERENKNVIDGLKDTQCIRNIKMENLSFRYGLRNYVLKNINLEIYSNEKIALVGESGSGKTTLARVLMGFYECEKGMVRFGGENLDNINKEWLRSKISFVSQEPYFFKGTIKENLLFGNLNAISNEEIKDVLETVKLSSYINEQPEGIQTKIQENAFELSGGQRQRLCLARALLRHPEILILDEATSNLDVITESSITKTISEFKNMTIIVIAHRLSTVRKCNRIVALKDGEIVEIGSHEDLIKKQGYYYSMWKEQIV